MASSGRYESVYILIALILMLMPETHAKAKKCVTYEPGSMLHKTTHCLELKCKRKNYVIFDLDIIAGRDNCQGQTSGLMVTRLNCFWTPKCMVSFPKERMLMGLFTDEEPTENRNECLYEQPEKIMIPKLKCAKKEDIVDICDTTVTQRQGIVRSHAVYPWNYARPDSIAQTCKMTHDLKKGHILLVTVLNVDLVEGDSLTINGMSVNETANYSFSDSTVVFSFTKAPPEQSENWAEETGQGFVLCFLTVESDNKLTAKPIDACDQLVKNTKGKTSISEIGPTTRKCSKMFGKRGKKKPSKKGNKKKTQRCCCIDSTCEADLNQAEKFAKHSAKMESKFKKC